MRSRSKVVAVVAAVGVFGAVAACGGGGVSASAFVDSVNEVCRTLDNDLGDLTPPASAADLATFAGGASKVYESAYADLKKLEVPGDDAVVASARGLLANYDDQITTLDAIAAAAKAGDQDTVDAKIAEFGVLDADNADHADALGADRCAFDPLFSDAIVPPVTDPPVTEPPVTEPPVTEPPITEVPVTAPPISGTNKSPVPLAGDLTAPDGFTFADTDATVVDQFVTIIDTSPTVAVQPGQVAGVEVIDASNIITARVFVFLPDTPMSVTATDELLSVVTEGAATTPGTYDLFSGVTYTDGDKAYFLGTNDPTAPALVIWVIATDQAALDQAVNAFTFAMSS